jgi:hypothetical protein
VSAPRRVSVTESAWPWQARGGQPGPAGTGSGPVASLSDHQDDSFSRRLTGNELTVRAQAQSRCSPAGPGPGRVQPDIESELSRAQADAVPTTPGARPWLH